MAALALVALRNLETDSPRLIEAAALAPVGLPLAILAGLIIAALTTGVRRGAAILVPVALVGVHASALAPFYLGARAPVAGPRLSVLAQNLEFGDAAAVARSIVRRNPDVVVLTDLVPPSLAGVLIVPVRDRYPYSVGVTPEGPEGTVVLSRYPVKEIGRISSGADLRVVAVEVPRLGALNLYAVHATPPYQRGQWRTDLHRIERAMAPRPGQALRRTIVAGDLNATEDHVSLRRLLRHGLTDSVVATRGGLSPTWPANGIERRFGVTLPPIAQIDHVLASHDLAVARSERIRTPGADHMGVLVQVGLRQRVVPE